MKVAIFYQSVTGNTKYISEMIKKGVEEARNQCDTFDIHNLNFQNFDNYDFLGFGAPVFAFREPKSMREFILNLPELRGKFAFLFCTCAGTAGNFFFRIANNLVKKGVTVFAKDKYYFPSSYTIWRKNVKETPGEPDVIRKEEIDKAISFGKSLGSEYDSVSRKVKPPPKIRRNISGTILGTFSSDWALRWIFGTITRDQALCTECGTCIDICPANAIQLGPIPIKNKKLCTGCCGCINACPVQALNSKKTKEKQRYRFDPKLIS
jgi:ferredoxin/flavodoxin